MAEKKEKKSAKKEVKVKEEKFSLYELVQKSNKPFYLIKPALIPNGLLKQYYQEKIDCLEGKKLPETLTKAEFTKIINKFIERKI